MKVVLMLATLAVVAKAITPAQKLERKKNIFQASRRIGGDARNLGDAEQEEEDYAFLADFTLKYMSCESEQMTQNEEGNYEYSAVVYRLCPSDDENVCVEGGGCSSGYGEYLVGLNTFMQNYFEDKREDYEGDDEFQVAEYGECGRFDVQNNDDGANQEEGDEQNEVEYFVGPVCIEEDGSVGFALYDDEYCSTLSETEFEDIAGYELPYAEGGLVSTATCSSCYYMNENGEYELSEFCARMYENSGKCESQMENYNANTGKMEGKCEVLAEIAASHATAGGNGAKIFLWVLLVVVVLGAGFFFYAQHKKKKAVEGVNNTGLMS